LAVVKEKGNRRIKIVVVLLFVLLIVYDMYYFDKIVIPTVISMAEGQIKIKAMEILNRNTINEYAKFFKYDDIIKVEKDKEGNIIMLRADTLKLNQIACSVSVNSQNELKKVGAMGFKIPIGYILKNNILARLGFDITFKMQPLSYVETKYRSTFESAGINQTIHRIYIENTVKIRIIAPFVSKDIEVHNEIPICESIIIGKVPEAETNLDLRQSSFPRASQ
jgi:sporulation protein YunB